jgi:hypothetical protein
MVLIFLITLIIIIEAGGILKDLRPMPYSDFTIDNVRAKLNLELQQAAFIPELPMLSKFTES